MISGFTSTLSFSQGSCACFPNDSLAVTKIVHTPRGTAVYGCDYPEFVPYSQDWWTAENFYLQNTGGSNLVLAVQSAKYNCHGYAFHMYWSSTWDPIRLCSTEADNYISDGSYNLVEEFNEADIILFGAYDHSAVNPNQDPYRIVSKWYDSKLVEHPMDSYNPYSYDGKFYYARAHDVPQEHSTLSAATNNSKSSQTFKLCQNYSLETNLDFSNQLKKKFEITTGNTLTLNSYWVKGKIYLNGSLSPYIIISDPSNGIVGLYPTLEVAFQNVLPGQIIIVQSNLTFSNGITIPSGKSVQINACTISSTGSIVVNGSLSCNGTTFNFSGGGISVTNPGSLNLSNCVIDGATTGVYLNNTSSTITNCSEVYPQKWTVS